MIADTIVLSKNELNHLLAEEENFFLDLKSKSIAPAKLSKSVSAFSNASGGEIFIGISEETRTHTRSWDGFEHIEDANPIFAMLDSLTGLSNYYDAVFLQHPSENSYVLKLTIQKTACIVFSTDNTIYRRVNAQSLPVTGIEDRYRLEQDKGIQHFEDEFLPDSTPQDAIESEVFKKFSTQMIPNVSMDKWLEKQKLLANGHLNVAGAMLFCDEPQVMLPKRSSVKVFRYKTSEIADRDMLDNIPDTIEGCAYDLIYKSVACVKNKIEQIKKLGSRFETIQYPTETLHEIITNAILHRDYSIATDIQIRIFDNRVEVESPGKLPGSVTVKNILESQSARNPKIVRLINKFENPPNKDVGEGLNTAFEAMNKLRLKNPEIIETESSVLVIIRHEKLASPEELVMNYLKDNKNITNKKGREITGIKSENTMKRVFYALRDQGMLEKVSGQNLWVSKK